jgi:hypothetical protein
MRIEFYGLSCVDTGSGFMKQREDKTWDRVNRLYEIIAGFELTTREGFEKTERLTLTRDESFQISKIIDAAYDRVRDKYPNHSE